MISHGNNFFYRIKDLVASGNFADAAELLSENYPSIVLRKDQLLELLIASVVVQGGETLVPTLVAAGANPNQRDALGETALEAALMAFSGTSNSVALVSALLENGADSNQPLSTGFRPLHMAASRGDVELIYLLKDFGADVSLLSTDPHPIDVFSAASMSSRKDAVTKALAEKSAPRLGSVSSPVKRTFQN